MSLELGSYVMHAKMPELGSGELLAAEKGKVVIGFASGERSFMWDLVAPHLSVTAEAPVRPPPKAAKRVRKSPAKPTKAALAKAAKAAEAKAATESAATESASADPA